MNKVYQHTDCKCDRTDQGTDLDSDGYDNECESFDTDPCSIDVADDNCNNAYTGGTNCAIGSTNYCSNCNHCSDSVQNCDETGVDCGGADCVSCGGTITGHITNVTGDPIEGAIVIADEYYIDEETPGGYYELTGVQLGYYNVKAFKEGYMPGSKEIEVSAGEIIENHNITLKEDVEGEVDKWVEYSICIIGCSSAACIAAKGQFVAPIPCDTQCNLVWFTCQVCIVCLLVPEPMCLIPCSGCLASSAALGICCSDICKQFLEE